MSAATHPNFQVVLAHVLLVLQYLHDVDGLDTDIIAVDGVVHLLVSILVRLCHQRDFQLHTARDMSM